MGFPGFMERQAVELELSIEELEKFIKSNIHPGAMLINKDGKLYVALPLDIIFRYEISEGKVKVLIPVKT